MKTRNGFVSNSSSSSFVIITTKEKWNEAVKKFKKIAGENITKIVVGEYGEPEKAKVLGQDALIFSGIICSEDYGNSMCEELVNNTKCNEDDVYDLAVEAFEKMGEFNEILRNDGVSYVS